MMRKLLILLLASVVALAAVAEDFDPLNADIEQNLTHPAVARKHSPAVKTGMSQLLRAIRALGFDASAVRDGEVVLVTIPASELFAPNAFTPKNAAITRLRPLMPYVKRSDNYKVIVAVHSDNTGDSFYNDSITVARADAIDDIMTRLNDGAETGVIPYGLGDDEPLAANISIEARRRNRRVEIYFVPTADSSTNPGDAKTEMPFNPTTFSRKANTKGRFNTDIPAADVAGRLVPRATDVEAAVLGALMLEKDAFTTVCELIKPESFYDPRHRLVYEAIASLGVNQEPIDLMTVTDRMRSNETLEQVGGAAFLVELTANVASAAHVEYHARIVAQKHLARELISFASQVENNAFDETNDVDDLLQEAEKHLFEISQRNVKREVQQIDSVINRAIEQMQLASHRESGLSGLASGFTGIDAITSGWQNSDLIIIAARPAMGKTAFVLSMALNIALNNNPVAVFSLEMSSLQLVNRLISNVCEMPGEKIKSGRLSQMEWSQLTHRLTRLQGAPLFVDDTSALSIMELRTKARRLVRENGVKMIIIDYLQLMNASGMGLGSREQEVSTISRSLKQLAKELDIPVVALSQLNRKVEDRSNKDKRPQLSDLRESGAIEQDADIVCFIHRPEYYTHSAEDAQGRDIRGLAEFIIAKHRSGSVDTVDLRFRKQYVRFENWSAEDGSDNELREASDNMDTIVPPPDPEKAAADIDALLGSRTMAPNTAFAGDIPADSVF